MTPTGPAITSQVNDYDNVMEPYTLELGTDVLDPDTDEVRHLIVLCWLLAPAFSDDHCSICADAHLSPVTVAYPRALNKQNVALSHATAARTSG
jgi:hypothetical protein